MTAMDTAAYAIEYVIRNGPDSLRSPAADLPCWKLQLLDVFALLITSSVITGYLLITLGKLARRKFLRALYTSREKKLK